MVSARIDSSTPPFHPHCQGFLNLWMLPRTENPLGIGALLINCMHAYAACTHGCTMGTLTVPLSLQNKLFVIPRGNSRLRHKKIYNPTSSNRKIIGWVSSYARFYGASRISVSKPYVDLNYPWRQNNYSSRAEWKSHFPVRN